MKAFSLKKKTKEQQKKRFEEIEEAYKKAIIPPLRMLELSNDLFYIIKTIQKNINSPKLSPDDVSYFKYKPYKYTKNQIQEILNAISFRFKKDVLVSCS